jgi:hypothetical protein
MSRVALKHLCLREVICYIWFYGDFTERRLTTDGRLVPIGIGKCYVIFKAPKNRVV